MSHFGLKISKTESPDKTPYTVYYPHTIVSTERKWTQSYYQVVSIDPARKNYALRIERRYHNGWITPVVFDKVSIESIQQEGDTIICNTYQVLTEFLSRYEQFYDECHFIMIERQLPQNYKATRIAQHSISYFSIRLHNKPLLPSIVEVDPKLKGKVLGAPKGINDKQLKKWAVEKARELLNIRKDEFSLQVLDHFGNKQDDLSDTICQIEAVFICWGLLPTGSPPLSGPDNTPINILDAKPLTLQLIPSIVIPDLDNIIYISHGDTKLPTSFIKPINNVQLTQSIIQYQAQKSQTNIPQEQNRQINIPQEQNRQTNIPQTQISQTNIHKAQILQTTVKGMSANTAGNRIMSLVQTAPARSDQPISRVPVTAITLNVNRPLTLALVNGNK